MSPFHFACAVVAALSSCFVISLPLHAEQTETDKPIVISYIPKSPPTSPTAHLITSQEIQKTGPKNMVDLLQNQGGIQLRDPFGDGSTTEISIRGFGGNAPSNSLVLVDGHRLNEIDIAPPDLTTLSLQDIERVEVIPGSASVLYGDQAVGGVVNFITRLPERKELQLEAQRGSFERQLYRVSFGNSHPDVRYRLSLQKQTTDNFRDRNASEISHLLGQIKYETDKNGWAAEYGFSEKDLQLPGALTEAQVAQSRHLARNQTDFTDTDTHQARMTFQHVFSQLLQFKTDASARYKETEGVLNGSPLQQSHTFYALHPRFIATFPTDQNEHVLTLGFDLNQNHYAIKSPFGKTKALQYSTGLFAHVNYILTPQWSTTLGGRYATFRTDLFDKDAFPHGKKIDDKTSVLSLGFYYQMKPSWTLFLRREDNFRFPKVDEQTFANNQILQTQKGTSWEGGTQWKSPLHTSKVSLYKLKLDNEIDFDPSQKPFGANVNLDPTVRVGAILESEFKPNPKWSTGFQYAFTDARFSKGPFKQNRIPQVAEHTLRCYVLHQPTDGLSLFVESQTTGNSFANGDYQNELPQKGGTTLFNGNLRYQHRKFAFGLRLNNIGNKEYHAVTIRAFDNTLGFFPAPKRNWVFTVEYEQSNIPPL